jgi:hypothetical protein
MIDDAVIMVVDLIPRIEMTVITTAIVVEMITILDIMTIAEVIIMMVQDKLKN